MTRTLQSSLEWSFYWRGSFWITEYFIFEFVGVKVLSSSFYFFLDAWVEWISFLWTSAFRCFKTPTDVCFYGLLLGCSHQESLEKLLAIWILKSFLLKCSPLPKCWLKILLSTAMVDWGKFLVDWWKPWLTDVCPHGRLMEALVDWCLPPWLTNGNVGRPIKMIGRLTNLLVD